MKTPNRMVGGLLLWSLLIVTTSPGRSWAHCDTMSGPVVSAARQALETGNANRALIWVRKADEEEIRRAFRQTLAVRKLSQEARELADTHFFETLVRVHRAGEGAPYTGLKAEDIDLGPAIPCADKALADGKVEPLVKLVTEAVTKGIREHFQDVTAKKDFNVEDVAAGREYVEAYVTYVHYVERVYEAAAHPVSGHYRESGEGEGHGEAR